MALFNQTTTVQKVIDHCSLHTSLQTFLNVGGMTNEPGLTICNNVLQMLLVKPLPWKFNRKELSGRSGNFLVTSYGVQDYRFAGATAFVLMAGANGNPSGGVGVDLAPSAQNNASSAPVNGGVAGITVSGSVATCQTIDPHPFKAGSTVFLSGMMDNKFNSTFSTDPVAMTSTWSGGFTISTVPDNKHFTFAAPSGSSATITNIAISNNLLTVTAANSYAAGQCVSFSSVGTNTFLNGQQMVISTASSTQFSGTFQHADVNAGADTGTATLATGAPGITDWGWMESASIQDINSQSFPQPVKPIEAVHTLPPAWANSGNPITVCMLIDYNNGVLLFRLSEPIGSQCFQINGVYQARATKLTSPQSVFPWPDDMAYVLHEVALFQAFRYAKGVTAKDTQVQMGIAGQMIQTALAGEDREASGMVIAPAMALAR